MATIEKIKFYQLLYPDNSNKLLLVKKSWLIKFMIYSPINLTWVTSNIVDVSNVGKTSRRQEELGPEEGIWGKRNVSWGWTV